MKTYIACLTAGGLWPVWDKTIGLTTGGGIEV